jgi:hypothetical protein
VGNDPSHDYVVHFTVAGEPRPTGTQTPAWNNQEANDTVNQSQDLGTLFPLQLQAGVTVTRAASTGSSSLKDKADYFRFEVLQGRQYSFTLNGSSNVRFWILDANGNPVSTVRYLLRGRLALPNLDPGTYLVLITGSRSSLTQLISPFPVTTAYQLRISLSTSPENPTPLTVGPAPVMHIRLASNPSSGSTSSAQGAASSSTSVTKGTPAAAPVAGANALIASTSSVTVGSDLLAGLIAGTVGGVHGPAVFDAPAFSDRLVLHSPESPFLRELVQTVVLTQPPLSGFDSGSAAEATVLARARDYISPVAILSRQAVDALLEAGAKLWQDMDQWLRELYWYFGTQEAVEAESLPDAPARPGVEPETDSPAPEQEDEVGFICPVPAAVNPLAVAAAFALMPSLCLGDSRRKRVTSDTAFLHRPM